MTLRITFVERFFNYAKERYNIFLKRKRGEAGPWTTDSVLQTYRFCNVFREDDSTTIWFRENIREPLDYEPWVLPATIIFRWFNRITTGQILLDPQVKFLRGGEFDAQRFRELLLAKFPEGPWVTGAYVIKTPNGMNKLDGLLWCIDQMLNSEDFQHLLVDIMEDDQFTLEETWRRLLNVPFLGEFMAYEVVTDLRHTFLLKNAPDIDKWANPGPGAARGMARVHGLEVDHYNRSSVTDRAVIMAGMAELLRFSRNSDYWPKKWPRWEMREVEHTLCEFDKYERTRLGEGRPKQLFRSNFK